MPDENKISGNGNEKVFNLKNVTEKTHSPQQLIKWGYVQEDGECITQEGLENWEQAAIINSRKI